MTFIGNLVYFEIPWSYKEGRSWSWAVLEFEVVLSVYSDLLSQFVCLKCGDKTCLTLLYMCIRVCVCSKHLMNQGCPVGCLCAKVLCACNFL